MAKSALIQKQKGKQKYKVREYNRCPNCGRSKGYMRRFDLCRICFRDFATKGYITGVRKSSW